MKKIEVAFLLSVFTVAGAVTWMSLSEAVSLYSVRSAADIAVVDTAGVARDADVEKLQRMLRQGYLSNHEAEFYKEFTTVAAPVEATPMLEETTVNDIPKQ